MVSSDDTELAKVVHWADTRVCSHTPAEKLLLLWGSAGFHPQALYLTGKEAGKSYQEQLQQWLVLNAKVVIRGAVGREVFEVGGGGGGSGTQKFVHQKWPDQIFPIVCFVLSHDDHFGFWGGVQGGTPPPLLLRVRPF